MPPPPACSVWLKLARREPEFRPLYRWRCRRVIEGLRKMRRKERTLFDRGGVK